MKQYTTHNKVRMIIDLVQQNLNTKAAMQKLIKEMIRLIHICMKRLIAILFKANNLIDLKHYDHNKYRQSGLNTIMHLEAKLFQQAKLSIIIRKI